KCEDFFTFRKVVRRMIAQKAIALLRLSIQNHINVIIAGLPRITQQSAALTLVYWSDRVTKPIQCLAQRRSPILIPPWLAAGVAATVAIPALEAVRTAPSAALPDFGFVHWRMFFQIFAVVCELRQIVGFDVI